MKLISTSLLLPVAGIAAVTACGASHHTTAADFTPGACRTAAPAVLDVGRLAHGVHSKTVSASTEAALTRAQATLRKQTPKPAHADSLITAIGFLRLGVDTDTYRARLLSDVVAAQRMVQDTCTSGGR